MKKHFILIVCVGLLVSFQQAEAQTEKGNLMVGAQIANIGGDFQKGSNGFNLDLSPSAAYFFENNLALGAMVSFGLNTMEGRPTRFSYGIGPWLRYYFSVPEKMRFSPHAAFFVDAFAGFQGVSHSKGGGSTNGLGIKVGPGISYFITKNVSLDASLNYNLILGFGNATTQNRLGLNIGFQIFLPAFDLKEKYQQDGF